MRDVPGEAKGWQDHSQGVRVVIQFPLRASTLQLGTDIWRRPESGNGVQPYRQAQPPPAPSCLGPVTRTMGASPPVHSDPTEQQALASSHIKVGWLCCRYRVLCFHESLEQTALATNTSAHNFNNDKRALCFTWKGGRERRGEDLSGGPSAA